MRGALEILTALALSAWAPVMLPIFGGLALGVLSARIFPQRLVDDPRVGQLAWVVVPALAGTVCGLLAFPLGMALWGFLGGVLFGMAFMMARGRL